MVKWSREVEQARSTDKWIACQKTGGIHSPLKSQQVEEGSHRGNHHFPGKLIGVCVLFF